MTDKVKLKLLKRKSITLEFKAGTIQGHRSIFLIEMQSYLKFQHEDMSSSAYEQIICIAQKFSKCKNLEGVK